MDGWYQSELITMRTQVNIAAKRQDVMLLHGMAKTFQDVKKIKRHRN
jgi:hypothetical protein